MQKFNKELFHEKVRMYHKMATGALMDYYGTTDEAESFFDDKVRPVIEEARRLKQVEIDYDRLMAGNNTIQEWCHAICRISDTRELCENTEVAKLLDYMLVILTYTMYECTSVCTMLAEYADKEEDEEETEASALFDD